jgi:hypothetical protein
VALRVVTSLTRKAKKYSLGTKDANYLSICGQIVEY